MSSELTCEQRISGIMNDRELILQEAYTSMDTGEPNPRFEGYDEVQDFIMEYALGFSKYQVVKIELSTGGPADWLECHVDDENCLFRVDYHFSDWFDHSELRVREGSALWRYAEEVVEWMLFS